MKFGMRTLDDVDAEGKTVLCRVDIEEPVNRETGELHDHTRISACVPTIKELSERGAKIVVLAHQGSDHDYDNFYTTAPHSKVLARMLGREVRFVDDVCGPTARTAVTRLGKGEVLMLDNLRFWAEEQILFEKHLRLPPERQAETLLPRKLAPLADLYVCDAFGAAHRNQPSLCGLPYLLPGAMGRLFEKELDTITHLMEEPARPCVFVLGGTKLATALQMISTVLDRGIADQVLVGGLVSLVLLCASDYELGEGARRTILERGGGALLETASKLMKQHRGRIVLPVDCGYTVGSQRREAMLHALPGDALITDIGSGTAGLFRKIILNAGTVFVNGPMGVYEQPLSQLGTKTVWDALGETPGYTVVCGEDSIVATRRYGKTGLVNHISTGNTSLIRYLSGIPLPVIEALRHSAGTAD